MTRTQLVALMAAIMWTSEVIGSKRQAVDMAVDLLERVEGDPKAGE